VRREPVALVAQSVEIGAADHDRYAGGLWIEREQLGDGPAGVGRFHADIDEDDVGQFTFDHTERLSALVADDDFVALVSHDLGHQGEELCVVVHDCDARHVHPSPRPTVRAFRRSVYQRDRCSMW
jgi:hypothetical protein